MNRSSQTGWDFFYDEFFIIFELQEIYPQQIHVIRLSVGTRSYKRGCLYLNESDTSTFNNHPILMSTDYPVIQNLP